MGKYDHITKAQLEELYINQNLSKPEIHRILNIPTTSLGRLLDKYNIKKSQALLKEMQSRLVNEVYANRTEEQRLNKIEKCRQATIRDLEFHIAVLKKVNSNRSEEHKAKLLEANKKFYENESSEHKENRIKKVSEATKIAINNMSEDKKQAMIQKRINTLKNKSPEEKQQTNEKRRLAMLNKSTIEIEKIKLKVFDTKKKNNTLWSSNFEKDIKEYITSLGLQTTKYTSGFKDTRFEIDVYIPEKKIGIECNGCWWHADNGPNNYIKSYHYNKSMIAKQKGIELIHLWEDQWKNKKDIVLDIIKTRLNLNDGIKIYARNCTIKELDIKTYRDFCENNHIQGYRSAKVCIGLYHDEELVQVASFNNVRNLGKQNSTCEYEWVRNCTKLNTSVIGGTSRLFKYFVNVYNPKDILCYADWNLFNGNSYSKLGFEFNGYTGPNEFFYKNSPLKRINRNPYKYHEHKMLVEQKKLLKCHGAGSLRFIWKDSKD